MLNNANECLYNRKQKFSVSGLLINIVLVIFIILIAFEIYFVSVYKGYYICHTSMTPTLIGAPDQDTPGGDYIYINMYAKPKYQDIVVVYDKGKGFDIVKRVVAFGGDTIKIEDGKFWLKKAGSEEWESPDESYLDPERVTPEGNYYNVEEHVVAENCMYLLGDNRNDSDDSRNKKNGDYEMQYIKGVVPAWALKFKNQTTAIHNFFRFKSNNNDNKDKEPEKEEDNVYTGEQYACSIDYCGKR